MSNRFQKLAKEAGFVIDGMGYAEGNVEMFAELIVKECAAYLHGAMEVHSQQEQNLYNHGAKKIKEHFGVKE